MDFDDTLPEAEFRAEARAWIAANAPGHLHEPLSRLDFDSGALGFDKVAEGRAWLTRKAEAGWGCLHWPKIYGGRDASPIERVIWQQEEGVYVALNRPFFIGQNFCGPTVMEYANEDQKRRLLPPLASGEEVWCQLFSEPAAGSDLAGLRTRAEQDGDDWVVNGQKTWTSGADYSDYGLLLARTDPTVAKHKGLTMFFVDMRSPGIEVRPIRQANGQPGFNEVWFDDVRVPDAQRMGAAGDGWRVSLNTLMNERFSIGAVISTGFQQLVDFCSRMTGADGCPVLDDPAVRSRLATWACRQSGLTYTGFRAMSALSRGELPGPENSIGKLVAGATMQEIAAFAIDLQAEGGVLVDPELAAAAGYFQTLLMRSPGSRLAGGTDEVLRNVIAERVLGLPPEPRVDKNVAFNRIPTSARR